MSKTRIEKDSLGTMQVPTDALYGAQTARAVENFPISGQPLPRPLLYALTLIKQQAALVNAELGLLEATRASAISQAAAEILKGMHDCQFPVDIYQTGSGTSSNMNANEVIAHRASQLLNHKSARPLHPNDEVNLGQSSNDVFPSAIHIACAQQLQEKLFPALQQLETQLTAKSAEFTSVIKIGRTHLQDATPITFGQVFSGYARQIKLAQERLACESTGLYELPLGGTAVGTGINTHAEFAARTIGRIATETRLPFREALNHFEAQAARDALVAVSGSLKSCAVSLSKIANDIRLLGSGPRCGYGELQLPAVQPGSSIMPGKVNPVMAESLIQVCARVIGNDASITLCGLGGYFELNTMMPLMAAAMLESIELLSRAITLFGDRCLAGLKADHKRCAELVEQSLALVTSLAPVIGYDRAADLAKQAYQEGKTIRELLTAEQTLPAEELNRLLDPKQMI
ncbi:class II fumarate hydratase [Geopsychrobacter electrodiphilus]|uniref:class II fumarate hydratase n=1 Tax=Geopsychrobacter electrodiphilus TaxID=225196 RepID=UPI000476176C|nr:class II fumarate hydratase [Geopsychrobacter electrodiphilus]